MIRLLFRPEVNLALSAIMLVGGICLSVGNFVGLIGQEEPGLIYQMSAWALIVSGYGNVLVSVVRQEQASSSEEGEEN